MIVQEYIVHLNIQIFLTTATVAVSKKQHFILNTTKKTHFDKYKCEQSTNVQSSAIIEVILKM